MLVNKRKLRLCALSSIVRLQAGPHGQTRWARRICRFSTLGRLENRMVSSACPPSQPANSPAQNG